MRGILLIAAAALSVWTPAGAQVAGVSAGNAGKTAGVPPGAVAPDRMAARLLGRQSTFDHAPAGAAEAPVRYAAGWPAPAGIRRGAPPPPAALAEASDSAGDPIVTRDDLLLAGLFMVGGVVISPVDRYFAERLQNPRNQENRFLKYTAEGFNFTAFPGSLIIGGGLYAYGQLRDDHETASLGLHGTEAIIFGTLLAGTIKALAGRARPYHDVTNPHNFGFLRGLKEDQYRSFPSGHTVAGFAAATVVTKETARWWPDSKWYVGTIMYGGATLIGASRMYTNNHWASDVVIGAAIGALSGAIIDRWHHRHPDNWIDRNLLPDEDRDALQPLAPPVVFMWSIPMPR